MQDEPVATESKVTESKVESQAQVEPPVATESKVEESKVESQTEPEPIPEPTPQVEETPPPPPPTPEPTPTPPKVEEPIAPPAPLTPDPIPEPPKPKEKAPEPETKPQKSLLKEEPEAKESKVETPPPVAPPLPPVVDTPPPTPPVVPAKHDPKYTKDVPQRVLELTEDEINAARKLWAREHIGAAQMQANKNRTARMNQRMDEIEKIIKAKPNISVHTIANSVQLSQKLTSGYLQKLVHAGRIKAKGNTNSRLFY